MFRPKLRYLRMSACVGCRWRLKSAYRFCSIGCKHVGACFFSFQKTVMVISLVIISLNRCYVASNCNSHGHRTLGCQSAHSSWRMPLNLAAHSIRSQRFRGHHARVARYARHFIEPYAVGEEQRTDEGQHVEHIPVIRYVAGCLSMFVIYGSRNLDPVLGRDRVTASHGPPVRCGNPVPT